MIPILELGLSILGKLIPDPAARAQHELELLKLSQEGAFKEEEMQLTAMKEISDRQKNDMASDSWLSKNIRPLIMIYLLTLVSLMGFNLIHVEADFLSMVREFMVLGLQFYFGGRTLEKTASIAAAVFTKKDK